MDEAIISGIQQLGVGVPDVERGFEWYRRTFGFDLPVFREAAEAPFMTRYTGESVQSRDAMLATNFGGGGGFEIWQYTSRTPQPPRFQVELGDLGIYAGRLNCRAVTEAYRQLQQAGVTVKGGITTDPAGKQGFFVQDPQGNLFRVVETKEWFRRTGHVIGGVQGALIGVSDMQSAIAFYQGLLGMDTVVYDEEGVFDDLRVLEGGEQPVRRVLLTHARPHRGPFGPLFGRTYLELLSISGRKPRKIFQDRYWGDLGFIHLCFDVVGMETLKQTAASLGYPFTIDSGDTFDMGEAGGRFGYVEDPDGTLIEFVETHRIPIMKRWNWYLDLRKRDRSKPLPGMFFTIMGLMRVRR
jgi:catechol 2,3-dioxygenase-like lactoylglutathione lyase family enzyme